MHHEACGHAHTRISIERRVAARILSHSTDSSREEPILNNREIVLCNPVRTAIGTYNGSLKDMPAPALGAAVIREALMRSGLSPDKVQTLVMGNVIQAGVKMNPARQAGIGAGLPVTVPALTVNRVCGSGAQAIASAALEIAAGMIDCAIAGGMENMDRAPYLMPQARWGPGWATSWSTTRCSSTA